ncbi:hypothetical protein AHAS_Ahas03G0111500 [Arachis hypogaea]
MTEMIAKTELEWEADGFTLTLTNKDLYIPHGNWLKDYPGFGDRKKKKKRKVTTRESSQPLAASSSGLHGPMTQELGLKILERLEQLDRHINRRYRNTKQQNRDWDSMLDELDTPKELSEEEDAAQGDGVEVSPPLEHKTKTGAIGFEVSPLTQQPADQPASSPQGAEGIEISPPAQLSTGRPTSLSHGASS